VFTACMNRLFTIAGIGASNTLAGGRVGSTGWSDRRLMQVVAVLVIVGGNGDCPAAGRADRLAGVNSLRNWQDGAIAALPRPLARRCGPLREWLLFLGAHCCQRAC
jgi:hypothetical protein